MYIYFKLALLRHLGKGWSLGSWSYSPEMIRLGLWVYLLYYKLFHWVPYWILIILLFWSLKIRPPSQKLACFLYQHLIFFFQLLTLINPPVPEGVYTDWSMVSMALGLNFKSFAFLKFKNPSNGWEVMATWILASHSIEYFSVPFYPILSNFFFTIGLYSDDLLPVTVVISIH